MSNSDRWQFWIDVGGTFTDCLARQPDGTLLRRKVLSSGVTKGQVQALLGNDWIVDAKRLEPEGFWVGHALRMLNVSGDLNAEFKVGLSLPGRISLASPLPAGSEGCHYELASPEDSPLLAIRLFLGLRLDEPIPPCIVRLGTTRGTNALLTRRGAKTALLTTRGHADVLRIGYQNRPKLFDLAIQKPEPLFADVAEIDERIAADGTVLRRLDARQARRELVRLKSAGFESLAICLLNAYANPAHEHRLAEIAHEAGFDEVSLSTLVSPLRKIVPRGDTTVVDAYLNPILRRYVERLSAALPGSDLRLLTSAGGLVPAGGFTGKDSILSGPAGGVVGFSRVAQVAGFDRAIGFDMGGTSTDVARFDGQYDYEFETEKAGVRIVAPMLAIETVAAGGGSICRWDGIKLVVGPESAGAEPGPACYGRGGPLTVTDCNLYLGRLLAEHFPFPLDLAAVERRLVDVAGAMGVVGSPAIKADATEGRFHALASGFLCIANANMAQAIRGISLAKGYDPADYVLVAFGAAGPQHACAVADELGIQRVLVHPDAGVLSALGMGLATAARHRAAGVYRPLDDVAIGDVENLLVRLADGARRELAAEQSNAKVSGGAISVARKLELRYAGTDATIVVAAAGDSTAASLQRHFADEHRRLYGYDQPERTIEIVAARVEAIAPRQTMLSPSGSAASYRPTPPGSQRLATDNQFGVAAIFERKGLAAGARIDGPAILVEPLTTTIIEASWQGEILTAGELLLTRKGAASDAHLPLPAAALSASTVALGSSRCIDAAGPADPVQLELMNNHFQSIAERMGIALRNTAMSVNVKERLDFSCAIFTAAGELVASAPHIPVHLGAMGQTVRRVLADHRDLAPGDAIVTNDPYRGGSHLPDVTVITPVFSPERRLIFLTASRAHHAEIGGITPGSMPPFSRNLAEEGVLIRSCKLLASGRLQLQRIREILVAGPFPTRSMEANLADLTAQLAANQQGAEQLTALVNRMSLPLVQAYMRHIQDAAARKVRQALGRLPACRREWLDHLDDGSPIFVAITIGGESAVIDFVGTGPVLAGNLNANPAIVTAAVMYVLRLLIGEDIPLNEGMLAPVEIRIPECLLNPPERDLPEECAAIVGGNVETSQRVVDVLLGALGLAAASQGTMNNFLFGDTTFGYYETICGGSGATRDAPGADAVHTHMTNTRLTDPEVLEARYPVRLVEFAIRRGSGGAGRHRGGDGIIRRVEFLRPLTVSILSQRRGPYPPYGMDGGPPGSLGRNMLCRVDGTVEPLPALGQFEVQPGDIVTIETPGGGGWGESASAARP
jgi:5-oxoprolinase (ATP-hydrolysing)